MSEQANYVIKSVWARQADICGAGSICGISRTTLDRLVGDGVVRTIKDGDAKQATRVYSVMDVLRWLDREAGDSNQGANK